MGASADKNGQMLAIGVFDSISTAEKAIVALNQAGFDSRHITAITNEDEVTRHFAAYEPSAGPDSWKPAAAFGASLGSLVGGTAATAALLTGAIVPVVVAGGLAGALAGGVVGGLTGAMTERGFEPEEVDYFVSAVADGRCLVALEIDGSETPTIHKAGDIMKKYGATSLKIPNG